MSTLSTDPGLYGLHVKACTPACLATSVVRTRPREAREPQESSEWGQTQKKWPKWELVFILNPMTCVTEGMRAMLFGIHGSQPVVTPGQYAISAGISLALLAVGVLMFQRTARTFIDYA